MHLNPQQQQRVSTWLDRGRFASTDAVLDAALAALEREEQAAEALEDRLEAAQQTERIEVTPAYWERHRARVAAVLQDSIGGGS